MTYEGRLLFELFVTRQAREAFNGVSPPVSLQLQPAAEAFSTLGADVLAEAVLLPDMSSHVVRLAEGQSTDRAAEGFLFSVLPHVSGEFVWSPEAPVDTDGTDITL